MWQVPDLPVAGGKGYDDGKNGGEPDQHGQRKLEIDLFFSKLRTYMRSSKSRARQTNNKISHKLRLNLFLNSIITIFYKIKLDII